MSAHNILLVPIIPAQKYAHRTHSPHIKYKYLYKREGGNREKGQRRDMLRQHCRSLALSVQYARCNFLGAVTVMKCQIQEVVM